MAISERLHNIIQEKVSLNRQRLVTLATRIDEILCSAHCADCEIADPSMLEFDHIRGKKLFTISKALELMVSKDELEAELEKCEVRCRNCHIKRHHPEYHRYLSTEYLDKISDKHTKRLLLYYGFRA